MGESVATVTESLSDHHALQLSVQGRRFRTAEGGEVHAVGALELSLPSGSLTCIVGPSGCGKTTTLRMILGLDKSFEGQVRVAGDGHVGAVFQEPRLLPWRTVEQNVRLAIPRAQAQRPLDDLFAALGLSSHRDLLPGELSLGLARRVSLARAFALEPPLIVLDEPFVSLDETTAARLRTLLLDIWRARPTTILMVTHDLDEAVALADRVIVFSAAPATVLASVDLTTERALRDEAWRATATDQLRQSMSVE